MIVRIKSNHLRPCGAVISVASNSERALVRIRRGANAIIRIACHLGDPTGGST